MEQHTKLPPKRITSSVCPQRILFPDIDTEEEYDYQQDISFFGKHFC